MARHLSARARAREQITAEILDTARRQLGEVGAASLSLRAVAREMGMASSAVYRYVESRDDLLTRLIIEAYDSLGDVAESTAAEHTEDPPAQRWVATASAIRRWALQHPQEYGLVYGSPVPGYAAPEDTVVPGTRTTRALFGIVADARSARQIDRDRRPVTDRDPTMPAGITGGALHDDLIRLRAETGLDLDDDVLVDVIVAWTQLFGLLSFELFNQTRGMVEDHEALFVRAAHTMAALIGLSDD